jgi:integrase
MACVVTKTEVDHIVPLSRQAIAMILEEIKPLTGSGRYVFPGSRGDGRPMSDNTIRTALKTLGYDSDVMTAYGFRTTIHTINEQGWSPDAIEGHTATCQKTRSGQLIYPINFKIQFSHAPFFWKEDVWFW